MAGKTPQKKSDETPATPPDAVDDASSAEEGAEQAIESAQVAARGLLTRHRHPVAGDVPAMEQPVQFAGVTRGDIQPAPALGAHTRDVLAGLSDLDAAVVERLCGKQEGTV